MSNPLRVSDLYVSPEEYLVAERISDTKHEYLAGVVYAMSGGTRRHNVISLNIAGELRSKLRGKQCMACNSDQRVRIRHSGATFYYYPDAMVDCSGSWEDEVDQPTVIFEVLSPNSDRADRGDKLLNYQSIPSMRVYVLVEQARFAVTVYRRGESGVWGMEVLGDSKATLELPEIGCSLPLAEIYDRVLPVE